MIVAPIVISGVGLYFSFYYAVHSRCVDSDHGAVWRDCAGEGWGGM